MNQRKQLPARANVGQLKKQAKDLHAHVRAGSPDALERVRKVLPAARGLLADAQLVIAREYGFESWSKLRRRVEAIDLDDPGNAFTEAACVPIDGAPHGAGGLEKAEAILASHPQIARQDVYLASILGDAAAVQRFVEENPRAATETGGLYDWDPLTYLCFSRYLRSDPDGRFVRAARILLDGGASASTGFYAQDHQPAPEFESVIYGAAGIFRHLGLTRLLLERGSDPNDGETAYHVPEGYENEVMKLLVESGKLQPDGLTTMLARKLDWHDFDGAAWLLDHGAGANALSAWGRRALHQSLERDNPLRFVELLLDHGADPRLANGASLSANTVAARAGRGDVLDLFEQRGFGLQLEGIDALFAACARGEAATADPALVRAAQTEAPGALADFAGAGNTKGVALLLDLGFDPSLTTSRAGARKDSPLHAAIWRARHETAKLLIARGAPLEHRNGHRETPLSYAVRAALQSEWTRERSAETVEALLAAGANAREVGLPTGWPALDTLIERHLPGR
jgi:ankyrin repeat protein